MLQSRRVWVEYDADIQVRGREGDGEGEGAVVQEQNARLMCQSEGGATRGCVYLGTERRAGCRVMWHLLALHVVCESSNSGRGSKSGRLAAETWLHCTPNGALLSLAFSFSPHPLLARARPPSLPPSPAGHQGVCEPRVGPSAPPRLPHAGAVLQPLRHVPRRALPPLHRLHRLRHARCRAPLPPQVDLRRTRHRAAGADPPAGARARSRAHLTGPARAHRQL